jgi:amidase
MRNRLGPFFRELLESGASVTDEQYSAASESRREFVGRFNAVLDEVDAIVCPSGGLTFPVPANLQYGNTAELEPLFTAVQMYFTIPADFAGTPTLTVPCGFADSGVPYALQFMGSRLSEGRLCRIGHAYENATDWHTRHPDV